MDLLVHMGVILNKDEALRLALDALEYHTEQTRPIPYTIAAIVKIKKVLLQNEAKDEPVVWNEGVPAMLPKQKEGETFIVSYEPKLEAKDEPANDELLRLRDLLGKANALARIRANEIESLKASLYGLYELEKQRDELEQRLTKTEAQLGEAVWNYGELKREQLANQQKTSGSPINSLTEADKIRNACPRTYNRCGYDSVAKKCVAEGCAGPQNWAVFCGGCGKKWGVPYQHPGKSICTECEAKLKATPPQPVIDESAAKRIATSLGWEPKRKSLREEMVKQMKLSCDSMEMRGAFADGWLSAEAAHGIKGEA